MSRTRKQPYTKSKAVDRTCRGRGGCPWCEGNRKHKNAKRIMSAKQAIVDAAIAWGSADTHDEKAMQNTKNRLIWALIDAAEVKRLLVIK